MSLKVFLLGQFNLQANNLSLNLSSRPAQSLLAYLVLHPGVRHRRETLAALLWPESQESNARSYLRQALWRVRKSFTSGSLTWQDYLQINDVSIIFDKQSDYWLDADQLIAVPETQSINSLIEVVNLYKGELLPGFYDEWIVLERDHLNSAYQQKMNTLIDCLVEERQWDDVLIWSENWILRGNAPEAAYRALMIAHMERGDQNLAMASYQRCEEALDRELGVRPSRETEQLFKKLRDGEAIKIPTTYSIAATEAEIPPFLTQGKEGIEKNLFVARASELVRLENFLHQAKLGNGSIALITGEAGSGKTSLIQEFTQRTLDAHSDVVVANGNCNAHSGIGDPFLPFREILELLTGDVESRWAAGAITTEQARSLWNTLPTTIQSIIDVGPDLIDTFVAGSGLINRASLAAQIDDAYLEELKVLFRHKSTGLVDPSPQQQNLLDQYTRVLQLLSQQSTLILIVDDLQWADLGSLSLLFHLGREISGFKILVIGAYRPEEVALERAGDRHPLEPVLNELKRIYGDINVNLDRIGSLEFVEAVIDSEQNLLGSSFREMIFKQTAGHPLFTIELLRGLQERGDLIQDKDGYWIEGSLLDWDKMPSRVEAVIAERIGRLKDPMQEVLRIASIEGELFTSEVLAQVLDIDPRDMLSCLSTELEKKHRLIKAHSIQRKENQLLSSYRFQHILFQKFLYSSLDEIERVHMHENIGRALENIYKEQEDRYLIAPQLVRHFHEAKNTTKEIDYLYQAGIRAIQMSAYQESISHLTRALDLLMTQPTTNERSETELHIQLALGNAWIGPKGYGQGVESAYTRARELCEELGEKQTLCQVIGQLSIVHFVRGEYSEARELAEEALMLAEQLGEPVYIVLGHWYLGFIWFYLADFKKVRAHLKYVLEYYDPQEHHSEFVNMRGSDAGISALSYEALCLWILGFPDQANKIGQEAIALARDQNHPFTLVDVLCYGGCMLRSAQHDTQKLSYYAEQMAEIALTRKFAGWTGQSISFLGEALARQGRHEEGIEMIQKGISDDIALYSRCSIIGAYRSLAEAQLHAGLIDQGMDTLNETLNLAESMSENLWKPELFRIQAALLLSKNDEICAEDSLMKSIQIAKQQEAKSWELRSVIDLAYLWAKQGRYQEAHQTLSEIYNWFTEGFDTTDLRAAKKLLAELSSK
jgi:DNA-binding SARP family transcriptional activator/tetratricopeptide (TPR) repeat protein